MDAYTGPFTPLLIPSPPGPSHPAQPRAGWGEAGVGGRAVQGSSKKPWEPRPGPWPRVCVANPGFMCRGGSASWGRPAAQAGDPGAMLPKDRHRCAGWDLAAGVWEVPVQFGALRPSFQGGPGRGLPALGSAMPPAQRTPDARGLRSPAHRKRPATRLSLSNPKESKIKQQTGKSGPERPLVCMDEPVSGQRQ